jgi:hypothetical protein
VTAARQPAVDPLAKLHARLSALEAKVARITRAAGPRDRLDLDVLRALADETAGLPFRTRDVFDRAELVDALHGVLDEAFITSSKSLGKLLARCADVALPEGLVVERLHVRGRSHWRVSVSPLS